MVKKTDKVHELNDLYGHLLAYNIYLTTCITKGQAATDVEANFFSNLLLEIGRKVGHTGRLITDLLGSELTKVDVQGTKYDMWTIALQIPPDKLAASALGYCIQSTNRAIGQLENDIKTGVRDGKTGKMISPLGKSKFEIPKAFVSHGKESVALNKLEDFLRNLGIIPLIVKNQPSLDKTVDDKVEYYLDQADFVIILATGDDKFKGKLHPRQNVIHEVGLSQKTHGGKIIYLLEEGTEFPSNISPKVWERFKQKNMLAAFLCIIRELRAFGMLIAVKYQT